ncbi:hypothetical protein C8J57DRAFT_1359379 [Mycena rebaudengoi]|nr:hypothetical protein C8J57DRAFT_1359379 [Mycena rebaudengoi]
MSLSLISQRFAANLQASRCRVIAIVKPPRILAVGIPPTRSQSLSSTCVARRLCGKGLQLMHRYNTYYVDFRDFKACIVFGGLGYSPCASSGGVGVHPTRLGTMVLSMSAVKKTILWSITLVQSSSRATDCENLWLDQWPTKDTAPYWKERG